jgi:hypothetical protein
MTGLPDLDRAGGRLTVAFEPENAFMMSRLEEGRAGLERHVVDFFGAPLRLVLELVGAGAGPSVEQQEAIRREVAPTDRETLARERQDDAMLDRLVEMVRGEPLAETERERWRPRAGADETDDEHS